MPVLYYITDRTAFAGNEITRRGRLLEKIAEATRAGVNYIQLREKDLPTSELERLARQAAQAIAETKKLATGNRQLATALLVNSRTDLALAVGASGVHLRSKDISPTEAKAIWKLGAGGPSTGSGHALARELSPQSPIVSISCHMPEEVARAEANGADLALFAPVFEKKDAPENHATGLSQLREACRNKIPVLALGGITLENARYCLDAGAAGIAAIRLFQENDIAALVRELRR
jgi:thiamine-phosphate pyrophosphorylase